MEPSPDGAVSGTDDMPRAPGRGKERRASIVIKETGVLLNALQADEKKSALLMAELEALLASSQAVGARPAAAAPEAISENFAAVRPLEDEDSDSSSAQSEEEHEQAQHMVPEVLRYPNDAHRRRSSIVTIDSSALAGGVGAGWRLAGAACHVAGEGPTMWPAPPSAPQQSMRSFTTQRVRLASGKSFSEARGMGSMRRSSVTDVGAEMLSSGMLPQLFGANDETQAGSSGSGALAQGMDADSPVKRRSSVMSYGSPSGSAPRSRATDSDGDGLLGNAAAGRATSHGSASGGRFMKILKGMFKPIEQRSSPFEAADGHLARLRTPSVSQFGSRVMESAASMDGGALSGMTLAPRSHSVLFAARPAPPCAPALGLAVPGLACHRSASMTARGGMVRPPSLAMQQQHLGADAGSGRLGHRSSSDRRSSGMVSFALPPESSAAAADGGGAMLQTSTSGASVGSSGGAAAPGKGLLPHVSRSKSTVTATSVRVSA
ncbi:hypothetical protein TSOC_013314 [Tetrabaena socialis]|uniref:Uncharacterized protein n=1 Tax=Tetrabaena socialis TaxID=47790 RepID=A0A2J7ZKN7_9CHLO|nr:hypothetical protein TSOC_013314 [Tetrabaena socialis]|eukprot:PNH00837.1 hypothetical protein TSOC_013314 [Tetrabaena socialis]